MGLDGHIVEELLTMHQSVTGNCTRVFTVLKPVANIVGREEEEVRGAYEGLICASSSSHSCVRPSFSLAWEREYIVGL